METIITMTIATSSAAPARAADLFGGTTGVIIARGRALSAVPTTRFVVDPRPAGPPV